MSAVTECPFVAQVNRNVLDFDLERVCSVTMLAHNVYGCLVCGAFFHGRGPSTPAYAHALNESHNMFINLDTCRIFCLPDNYEVRDPTLSDVQRELNPTFDASAVALLSSPDAPSDCAALDGTRFVPGLMALQPLKHSSAINCILLFLFRVVPLRTLLLQPGPLEALLRRRDAVKRAAAAKKHAKTMQEEQGAVGKGKKTSVSRGKEDSVIVVEKLGELCRRVFNAASFRAHRSAHEVVQAVAAATRNQFAASAPGDPVELLQWMLRRLDRELGARKATAEMHGKVKITTRTAKKNETAGSGKRKRSDGDAADADDEEGDNGDSNGVKVTEETTESSFSLLTLDIPPAKVFQENKGIANAFQQVPIADCLAKFDGKTTELVGPGKHRVMCITELPEYLIIHLRRFKKNTFSVEKNTTIVTFPLKGLEMRPFCTAEAAAAVNGKTRYSLVANIRHYGKERTSTSSTHRIHALHESGQWFDIDDAKSEKLEFPDGITISEAYLQLWRRDS